MIVNRTNVVIEGPARKIARGALPRLLLSIALATCCFGAPANADVTLYQAAVPLKGSTEADRAAAFGEALKVAAVRASGRREAAEAPAIATAAAAPAKYVQQYSTTTDRLLKVGFDGRAMEQLLQQAGLPLWPAERPETTVLLFLASVGGGARAVMASERPVQRIELERAAQARGVPLNWPAESVDPASARARVASTGNRSAILLGMPGAGGQDWTFGHAGLTARGQGGTGAGMGLAADTLAGRYAPASTRSLSTLAVRIGGLVDVRAYAALSKYLESLSLVRAVSLRELTGSTVLLELSVRGDMDLLRRIVALDGRLVPGSRSSDQAQESPDFLWQP